MSSYIFTHGDGRLEIHPLFNPIVFDKIMQFSSIQDMKEVMVTCEEWKTLVLRGFQKRGWVKFLLESSDDKFDEFLMFINQNPVRTVVYENFEFSKSFFLINHARVREFIVGCGAFIKSLHFAHINFEAGIIRNFLFNSALENLQDLFFNSCSVIQGDNAKIEGQEVHVLSPMRNLKKFSFKDIRPETDFNIKLLPFSWDDFFPLSPVLEELEIMDFTEDMLNSLLTSMASFQIGIKHLNIFGNSNYSALSLAESHWDLLNNSNLILESLQIDIGINVNEKKFEAFLRQQSQTLRSLKIWRGMAAKQLNTFPYGISLPNLLSLQLPLNMITSLTFANYTKNLTNLWIGQCDNFPITHYTNILESVDFIDLLLKLNVFRIDSFLSSEDVTRLRLILPSDCKIDSFVTEESNESDNVESDWEADA